MDGTFLALVSGRRIAGLMGDLARPEGIEPRHVHEASGSLVRRRPFDLAGLGLLLGLGFFGFYGADASHTASADGVELAVEGPGRIRNGEFFEMSISVATTRDIADVVILIDTDVWRDVTVNTLLPDPAEHGFRDDAFEFRFGALNAGESLHFKIDGQINPSLALYAHEGAIYVGDGDAVLAAVTYAMEVLP